MNTKTICRLTATIMGVAVLVSTGCTMPPWRGKQTAKHDATHEYIERTAADIQYDTDAATPANDTAYAAAATADYGSSSGTRAPRANSTASSGSCCH